ncbi:hypothetical protein MRX96_014211 [Rhipicephalus microplus]
MKFTVGKREVPLVLHASGETDCSEEGSQMMCTDQVVDTSREHGVNEARPDEVRGDEQRAAPRAEISPDNACLLGFVRARRYNHGLNEGARFKIVRLAASVPEHAHQALRACPTSAIVLGRDQQLLRLRRSR